MAKIALFLLAIVVLLNDQASAGKGLAKCPKIKPLENFDIKRVLGDWYMLATNINGPINKCGVISLEENGETYTDFSFNFLNPFEQEIKGKFTAMRDESRPGVFSLKADYEVKGLFGRSRIESLETNTVFLYTDYDNILVGYSCVEIPNFWMPKVQLDSYVLVRNRDFDSLKQALQAIGMLANVGVDLNNIVIEYQGEKCTN